MSTIRVGNIGPLTGNTAPSQSIVSGPSFSAYLSSTQNISSDTPTKMQINTEEWDTANCYDNSTNYRFTPNVAGYYMITGQLSCRSATSIARVMIMIYKNGSLYRYGNDINSSTFKVSISSLVYFNGTTDYVELWGLVQSTSPQFTADSYYSNWFQGYLARPSS